MKNALISPNEPRETGYRIAEISNVSFDVATPLFWIECNDDIIADEYWYDPVNKSFEVMPQPEIQITTTVPSQPITSGSQDL